MTPEPQQVAPTSVQEPKAAAAVVRARRDAAARAVVVKKEERKDAVWVCRCAVCQGIGIVFVPPFDPQGAPIQPHNWVAMYREDPSAPWYKREIYCQECNSRGQKTPLRLTYNEELEGFIAEGRLSRFLEEFDPKSGRFVRHVEAEKREKVAQQRELLVMAELQRVISGKVGAR